MTVPESVTDIDLTCFNNRKDITYYGKTGSYFYYLIGADEMISTGVAEHPYIELSGSSKGIHWSFDYASRMMTIGGSLEDLLEIPSLLREQTNYVLLEEDLVYPMEIDANKGYNIFVYDALYDSLLGEKVCYFYQNSNFAKDYEQIVSSIGQGLPRAHYADKDIVYGDVNLDGKVDLLDCIVMNKVMANIITLTDLQKITADCNGDGSVQIQMLRL